MIVEQEGFCRKAVVTICSGVIRLVGTVVIMSIIVAMRTVISCCVQIAHSQLSLTDYDVDMNLKVKKDHDRTLSVTSASFTSRGLSPFSEMK